MKICTRIWYQWMKRDLMQRGEDESVCMAPSKGHFQTAGAGFLLSERSQMSKVRSLHSTE